MVMPKAICVNRMTEPFAILDSNIRLLTTAYVVFIFHICPNIFVSNLLSILNLAGIKKSILQFGP